jgi:hypothetical protein
MIGSPSPLSPSLPPSSGTPLQLQSQSIHRVAIAGFWNTSHHDGKISPEPELLNFLGVQESIPLAYVAGWPVRHPCSCSVPSPHCPKILALAGEGAVYAPAERADTLPLYLLYPICTLWLQQ